MDKKELLKLLQGIEGAGKVSEDDGNFEFVYRDFVKVQVDIEYFTTFFSGILYDSKFLANGKIAKAYQNWMQQFISGMDPYYVKNSKPANVGNAHCFVMFYSEDTIVALPDMLSSFLDEFLPSIREFIKGEVRTVVNL